MEPVEAAGRSEGKGEGEADQPHVLTPQTPHTPQTPAVIDFQYQDATSCWLSNFFVSPFTLEGKEYQTVEHYFQSQKFKGTPHEESIRSQPTARSAKIEGGNRSTPIRDDWEAVKLDVMYNGVYAKFVQNAKLKKQLIATHDARLVHMTQWGDNFWGSGSKGQGMNMLGIILMQVRQRFYLQIVNRLCESNRKLSEHATTTLHLAEHACDAVKTRVAQWRRVITKTPSASASIPAPSSSSVPPARNDVTNRPK